MANWRDGTSSKRSFPSSKNYNWRIRAPQIEEEINVNRRNERSTLFHSFAYIIKLINQNSDEIILKLIEKLEEFSQFLESNLENDLIVLTVAILAKMCSSSFRRNKFAILKRAAETSFLQKLDNYVRILNYEERARPDKNKHFWRNPEEFFDNLLFLCDFLTEVGSKSCEILPKLLEVTDLTVLYLEEQQKVKIGQKTKLKITTLKKKLNLCEQGSGDPLNTSRNWNVGLTSEDFLKSDDVLASEYLVEGRYDNVEHYLDVQFRLSKEYFVTPFREHITNCIEDLNKIKDFKVSPELRLYSDMFFHSIVFTNDEVRLILKSSGEETINEIFPEYSANNYFRPGTLVFLTKDNFVSVLIGHVIERDHEEEVLIIRFGPEFYNYDLNGSYTVVGTKVFYQPYYNCLKALQRMPEVDFPMKKYLIDVDPSMETPDFLNSSSVYTIQGKTVDLFGNNWPSADELKMDSSQYSAFKAALTQKCNVIQGFPGTGITYLGLQIVKTLLHEDNRKIWYNGTPILIVSSSNFDLDLFLEGLMSTTSKIIRVGENVTKQKLEEFLLSTARKENNAYYVVADTWKRKIRRLSHGIEKWIRHLIQIKKFNDIINFKLLADMDENIKTSWFSRASNADISAWLFRGPKAQNVNPPSIEISEIINKITEEAKPFGCEDDITAYQEQATTSADQQRTVLLSKARLWLQMERIAKRLQNLETQINQTDVKELEAKLINLWQIYQFFQVRISDRALSGPLIKPTNVDYDSPDSMDSIDRWNLYFYWLNIYIDFVEKKIVELQYEHRELSENLTEIGNIIDLGIIKRSLVLGMTAHAAVRLHTTLQALKCRIMVVNEASEILESQLVVSLTKHCEQLILLGNHQRLRPIEAADNISKRTSAISIMERMVNNKMKCHVLRVQHRMSASISHLFVPHFYPEFDSYRSITPCPALLGIPSCTFFIHQEPQDIDEYSTEEYYLYEAKFLINLALYLRRIGYEPEDITILTAYYNQAVVLRCEREKYEDLLEGVRIVNVVQYPGHESKIILLSLVTNNQHRTLGYLKNESGIIFALSRAKEYLYMMGNINLLCENSEKWPKIKEALVEQNCLGNYFPLCCERNPNHIIQIKRPEDFEKIPNGVCSDICGSPLNCGHRCLKSCHILECDHISSITCSEITNPAMS